MGVACAALLGAWPFAAPATEEPPAAFAPLVDFAVSADTDGFHASRSRLGELRYDNPWSYAGVLVQSTRYTQGRFAREVPAVLAAYRDQRRDTLAGVEAEAGVVNVNGHARPIGDVTLRLSKTLGTAVELIASADVVETRKALERGIGHAFLAAGFEHALTERFTAIVLAGWQAFTDGNARPHLRARLVWLAVPEQGVTLQLRYRQYASRDEDVEGAYFNPERYRQWLGVAAIRKRLDGWIYSGALGAGREQLAPGGSRPSYLAEIRAEGPLAGDARLVMRAAYNRSAGYVDAADYAYRQLGLTVLVPLR